MLFDAIGDTEVGATWEVSSSDEAGDGTGRYGPGLSGPFGFTNAANMRMQRHNPAPRTGAGIGRWRNRKILR